MTVDVAYEPTEVMQQSDIDSEQQLDPSAESQRQPPPVLMDPDHPMLSRAQQALHHQLLAKRIRVEGELREKQTALSVRAWHGVHAYISPPRIACRAGHTHHTTSGK